MEINLFLFRNNVVLLVRERNFSKGDKTAIANCFVCLDWFDFRGVTNRVNWEMRQIGAILEKNFIDFEEILCKSSKQ